MNTETADVKAVSEMLGHANVGFTLKIYHHVNTKSIRQMHKEYSPLRDLKMIVGVQSSKSA